MDSPALQLYWSQLSSGAALLAAGIGLRARKRLARARRKTRRSGRR